MTYLQLDPPVTPISPRVELEAWRRRLKRLQQQYNGDITALGLIEAELRDVEDWLT